MTEFKIGDNTSPTPTLTEVLGEVAKTPTPGVPAGWQLRLGMTPRSGVSLNNGKIEILVNPSGDGYTVNTLNDSMNVSREVLEYLDAQHENEVTG